MFHVMSRGNRRTAIFKEDSDYLDFPEYLGKVKETFGFKLHTIHRWCGSRALITNRVEEGISAVSG